MIYHHCYQFPVTGVCLLAGERQAAKCVELFNFRNGDATAFYRNLIVKNACNNVLKCMYIKISGFGFVHQILTVWLFLLFLTVYIILSLHFKEQYLTYLSQ